MKNCQEIKSLCNEKKINSITIYSNCKLIALNNGTLKYTRQILTDRKEKVDSIGYAENSVCPDSR